MVRSHARSLARIFRLGSYRDERNKARCFENISSWTCDPPVLRATAETHTKPDKKVLPKSHPIVGAARGLTTPLGEPLLDLIEPVAKARPSQWEAKSTEEVLYKFEMANERMETNNVKELIIGSLEIEALYPSID